MLNRRLFCGCLAAAPFAATAALAQQECAVFTPERQKDISIDQALARLVDGNARFVGGKSVNCDRMAQVRATGGGQAPFAAVVGCIDSRVPPEMVFDQGIGDLFTARVAGNFVNTDILGSMEFATAVAGAKVLVILGHNSCGGIKGAIDNVELGNLTSMLKNFEPAMRSVGKVEGEQNSHNGEWVQRVAVANARLTAQSVPTRSKVMGDLVAAGKLKVVAAMHDIGTGKVTFLT